MVLASHALLLLLASSPSGLSLSAPPLIEAELPSLPRVGVSLTAGMPSGAGVELAFRPWPWLRFEGGPSHNGASVGVGGGITLVPLQWAVRPTLSVSGGHFPEGDVRGLVRAISGAAGFPGDVFLSKVQYDYASAHFGLELGSARSVSLSLRGGVSRVALRLPGFEDAAREMLEDPALTASVPQLELLIPSVQLGLLVYVGG